MRAYTSRLLAAICVLFALCVVAPAQSNQPRESFKLFTLSDGAFWGGALLDLASSVNKREANPLWRDSQGFFSPGNNLAFKGALWGTFKWLEFRYRSQHERKLIRLVKIGAGVGFSVLAIRNFGVSKVR
jgi:hypothetical protein